MLFNAGLDLVLVYRIEAAPLSYKSCEICCCCNTRKSHQNCIKALKRLKGKAIHLGEPALMG